MSQSLLIDDDYNPITNPFYYAQDIMADSCFNQEEVLVAENEVKLKSNKAMKKKPKAKKRIDSKRKVQSAALQTSSYIIRKESRKAIQLIKINIIDLGGSELNSSSDSDSADVSVQYIVTDRYDDVAYAAKSLISKIVKKINDDV